MKAIRSLALAACVAVAPAVSVAAEPVKAVYHLTEGFQEARRALGNIRNHLNADPEAKIVVVANGAGIDFLLQDAKSPDGRGFAGPIGELANRGVEFRVCENTLKGRDMGPDQVVMEATIVPSGVAEAARLQARERYAYIKP